MSKIIIFIQDGSVIVMTPVPQEVSGLSVQEVAEKDVPEGLAYWLINSDKLPLEPQQTWEISEAGENGVVTVTVNPGKLRKYYVAQAEGHKKDLLSLYRTTTANWNTDLQLGDISDDDRENLIAWRNWRKSVEAVDTSTASGENPVTFPEYPAN